MSFAAMHESGRGPKPTRILVDAMSASEGIVLQNSMVLRARADREFGRSHVALFP